MDEMTVLMARRERMRIKKGITENAKIAFTVLSDEVRPRITFPIDFELQLTNAYDSAACKKIIRELTLEIIDDFSRELERTKARIQAQG